MGYAPREMCQRPSSMEVEEGLLQLGWIPTHALRVEDEGDLPSGVASCRPGAGRYRTGAGQLAADDRGEGRVSAEDYAVAPVDETETPRRVGRRFAVAY